MRIPCVARPARFTGRFKRVPVSFFLGGYLKGSQFFFFSVFFFSFLFVGWYLKGSYFVCFYLFFLGAQI